MQNNKDIVARHLNQLWVERDISAIDEVLAENAEIHSPMHTFHGKQTMHYIVEKWLTAFPDLTMKWHDLIAEGDKVVCRFTADGTHLGGFFETKPTYREVHFTGVMIFHLKDQKITDYWSLVDIHAILSQLEEYATLEEALES